MKAKVGNYVQTPYGKGKVVGIDQPNATKPRPKVKMLENLDKYPVSMFAPEFVLCFFQEELKIIKHYGQKAITGI